MKSRNAFVFLAGVASVVLLMGFDCVSSGGEVVCGNGFSRTTGSGDFGTDENARKLEAFLDAVAVFDAEATTLINQAEDVCFSLGEDIGISPAELQAAADEGALLPTGSASAVCRLVADQMEADRATIESSEIDIFVDVQMPECSAELNAMAECYARCEAEFSVERTPLTCEGGGIYVDCNVGCSGQCRLPEVEAECNAYCEGTCTGTCAGNCSGSCSGVCTGWCEGECEMIDPETGQCAGGCEGTCHGECDASCEGYCTGTCEGSCSGGCVVEVTEGECQGECWGECSADVEPVRCVGGEVDVQASAECQAACEAEVSFEYECDPPTPQVFVEVLGDDAEVIALATTYAQALANNLPDLVLLTVQLGYVIEATAGLVATSADGLEAAIDMSAKAIACTILAVDIVVEVDIQFSATVDATYSVAGQADVATGEQPREY